MGTASSKFVAAMLRGLIRAYQLLVAPVLGPRCRYLPSCSEYASEAIRLHGPVRGGLMGLARILRCNPLGGAGFDPVPGSERDAETRGERGHVRSTR